VDLVGIGCRQAGEAEHLPGHHVAVAAIDRIAEEALQRETKQLIEEGARREVLKFGLAAFHRFQRCDAVGLGEPVEVLAVSASRPFVGRDDAGPEELAWCQRQLIALLGLAFVEWAAAIHPGAAAPGAGVLAVDNYVYA